MVIKCKSQRTSSANPSLPLHEVLEDEFIALHGELSAIRSPDLTDHLATTAPAWLENVSDLQI